ncbi:LARP7 family RNA-binding protein Pof8/Lar7 [Schizosaccharomyces osmophilus]|uniref:LARP7 family RNA-binding protein Pof8/Lar7 n=1 Tax=Schizosaccharomyces osmophilus TaxID=2545709 RepID=A0AAF0AY74_9SCHI|nr:LARP7 family RNA-binding protein Pof8/Lar7 [Schizosaccharomyces osmophilus]WBW74389.1 LARP7 family RNA-binding protein Pof8/Lar7 [Schizosaccharomyces osmophilus]
MFLPRQVNIRNKLTGRDNLSTQTALVKENKNTSGSNTASSNIFTKRVPEKVDNLKPEFIRAVECMIEILFYKESEKQKFHLTYLINKEEFWQGLKPSPTQANVKQCVKTIKNKLFTFDEESHFIIRNEYKLDSNLDLFERIVYVEPFPATVSNKPFLLAGLLREFFSGFLPYLDVIPTPEGYAFLVLAHSISQETLASLVVPQGWNILSREEWTKREEMYMEYQADSVKSSRRASFIEPRTPNQSFRRSQNEAVSSFPKHQEHRFKALDNSGEQSQRKTLETERYFPKGLLTRLTNLHRLTNKSTIQSLLHYVFSRQDPTGVCEPMYIDYRKDETEAIVRWKSPEQANLCVKCFSDQHRKQDTHDDIRAHRKHNKTGPFISAELIEGSEEQSYWNQIHGKLKK